MDLSSAATGRAAVQEALQLDQCAPADHLYVHVASFARAVELAGDVEAWGATSPGRARGDRSTPGCGRAMRMRCSWTTARWRPKQATGECGVVLADPFVREDTDVALILEVRDRARLDAAR